MHELHYGVDSLSKPKCELLTLGIRPLPSQNQTNVTTKGLVGQRYLSGIEFYAKTPKKI